MRPPLLAFVALICTLMAACGPAAGGDGGAGRSLPGAATMPESSAEGTAIGSAGGTLISGDGLVSIAVPPGALKESVDWSIASGAEGPPGSLGTLVSEVYAIAPVGQTLARASTVTATYDPSRVFGGECACSDITVAVLTADGWRVLSTIVDQEKQTATALMDGLHRLALVVMD